MPSEIEKFEHIKTEKHTYVLRGSILHNFSRSSENHEDFSCIRFVYHSCLQKNLHDFLNEVKKIIQRFRSKQFIFRYD
ncbi:unnamed protein product [Rhizophagus irregularis]|nr:unnamed protein product [Rhizophagus irregularis]